MTINEELKKDFEEKLTYLDSNKPPVRRVTAWVESEKVWNFIEQSLKSQQEQVLRSLRMVKKEDGRNVDFYEGYNQAVKELDEKIDAFLEKLESSKLNNEENK